MGTFTGMVAVITGAGGGLGETYARALASAGAGIAVLDVKDSKKVAGDLTAGGSPALALETDVSDRSAVMEAVDTVLKEFGRVDILINNAAAGSTERGRSLPWYELPQEDWDRAMNVNVRGAFFCAAAVAPHMIGQKSGKIVNVGSASFWKPAPRLVHYIASKGGVIALTRALAIEFGESGVTVNSLSPGMTRTERVKQIYPAQVFEDYAAKRAIPRVEEPSDLVGTLMYLCSPASDFVTGQSFLVDGGHAFD